MTRTETQAGRCWLARRLQTWRRQAGFSLAETTIILGAMSVLTATAAPSIMDYVAEARGIKVKGDVQVLTGALARLVFDVSSIQSGSPGKVPDMLVGPGDPVEAAGGEGGEWTAAIDGNHVQSMVEHLVTNGASYPGRSGAGLSARGWGGPYVDFVPVDPWGHRYAANIGVLGTNTAVVVMSAGPNGQVETSFRLNVYAQGGDDVLGLLGSRR